MEIQVNIYWHSLLKKWVGEVTELEDKEQTCIFYKEHVDRNLVLLKVAQFLASLIEEEDVNYA